MDVSGVRSSCETVAEEVRLQAVELLQAVERLLQLFVLLLKLAIALAHAGEVHLRGQQRLVAAAEDEIQGAAQVLADECDGFRFGAWHARQKLERAIGVDLGVDANQRVGHARHFGRQKRTEYGLAELAVVVVDRKNAVLRAGEAGVGDLFGARRRLDRARFADGGHARAEAVFERTDVVADLLAGDRFGEKKAVGGKNA